MLSTHYFAHLTVLVLNLYFMVSLTRQPRLISLAHWTTKIPFSLHEWPNLLAPGNRTRVFSFQGYKNIIIVIASQATSCNCRYDFRNWSCPELFEGYAMGFQPMERKGEKPQMLTLINNVVCYNFRSICESGKVFISTVRPANVPFFLVSYQCCRAS